ncbi:flagellar basal body L-ring protein FlgH [Advenella alkanexedens]|uniref:flagellar basal body L-ring protein FlgH n=1 Tax=Advenella alkanexedens TaxID=1481665 RepID=UPI002674995E|nr:flagellar basal body L-ring protein FlgH [Advenella alkanexedens]WKU20799.1 flagellar basal body L-ring protein FlgH [Advenella alkanexedens]
MSLRSIRLFMVGLIIALASGCAMVPHPKIVEGPLTATPTPAVRDMNVEPDGSIFQAGRAGMFPLFEDRRPRNVGDIVTVVIEEKTNASKRVATTTNRNSGMDFGVTAAPDWMPGALSADERFSADGSNDMEGKGSSSANNMFTGNITTTVIDVLANGNLRIAGEKAIAINQGSEHLRFSGVVDPRSITGTNTVSSTQVADARIEFRSKGVMDEVQTMGWLQRFFLNIAPF